MVNPHLIYKYHVKVIMEGKYLSHPPFICPLGQKSKVGYSGLSLLATYMDKTP